MKSGELSHILKQLSDLLSLYPNNNLPSVLDDLINIKQNAIKESYSNVPKLGKVDEKTIKEGIDKLVDDIDMLSITEIESKLNLEDMFPSMDYVRYFASKVGVDLTKRQNRINSIHTILKQFDRMRIDRTISKRND